MLLHSIKNSEVIQICLDQTVTHTHTHTHTPHLHLMGLVAMVNAVVAKIHFYTLVKIEWYGDCSQLGFSVHGILQARILE